MDGMVWLLDLDDFSRSGSDQQKVSVAVKIR